MSTTNKMDLPATDLRVNVLTLAVPNERLPGVGYMMRALLPAEGYDPNFQGQYLQTTYFDTPDLVLRKARLAVKKYLTIRIRCYAPVQQPGRNYPDGVYALSCKSEDGKYRMLLPSAMAERLLKTGMDSPQDIPRLPGALLARYLDLVADSVLRPAVTVCFTRYAVESTTDRLTLDTAISTSSGKVFPTNILEVKSSQAPYEPVAEVTRWGFSPVKLSKFLWATTYGVR